MWSAAITGSREHCEFCGMRLLSQWRDWRMFGGRTRNSCFAVIGALVGVCTDAGPVRRGRRAVLCPYISPNIGSSRTAAEYDAAHTCARKRDEARAVPGNFDDVFGGARVPAAEHVLVFPRPFPPAAPILRPSRGLAGCPQCIAKTMLERAVHLRGRGAPRARPWPPPSRGRSLDSIPDPRRPTTPARRPEGGRARVESVSSGRDG